MSRTLALAVITARAALPGTAADAITAMLACPPLTVPAAGGRAREFMPRPRAYRGASRGLPDSPAPIIWARGQR